jgi:hypothetical protein
LFKRKKGIEIMKKLNVLILIFAVTFSRVQSKKHYISEEDDSHPAFQRSKETSWNILHRPPQADSSG